MKLALVENCDAVCLGRFEPGSTWHVQLVHAPEGVELKGVETSDGTRWVRMLRIHLTADYFGNLTMTFSFKGKEIGLSFEKTAEWFLNEYEGMAGGRIGGGTFPDRRWT